MKLKFLGQNYSLRNLPDEEWRDIIGCEGIYQISNMGRVKSLERVVRNNGFLALKKCRLLVQQLTKGYPRVCLYHAGKPKYYTVHRLVGLYFVENTDPINKIFVNHKKGIKTDNRASELEWCTGQENTIHSYALGLQKGKNIFLGRTGVLCANSIPVIQMDLNGSVIKEWAAMSDVKKELNINSGEISRCCKGLRKTCHGFKWKYKNDLASAPRRIQNAIQHLKATIPLLNKRKRHRAKHRIKVLTDRLENFQTIMYKNKY